MDGGSRRRLIAATANGRVTRESEPHNGTPLYLGQEGKRTVFTVHCFSLLFTAFHKFHSMALVFSDSGSEDSEPTIGVSGITGTSVAEHWPTEVTSVGGALISHFKPSRFQSWLGWLVVVGSVWRGKVAR